MVLLKDSKKKILRLSALQRKKTKIVAGIMSGTSVDSIDVAIVKIHHSGLQTRVEPLVFRSHRYPKGIKELVLSNSLPGTGSVDLICRMNILLARLFVNAVIRTARSANLRLAEIDLIGSHGQTIHHLPRSATMAGITFGSTLQIGDPSTIAALTGIPTVGNFRTADMALGGQGAPLVPYVDFLLCRSAKKTRLLLNLGGIANITVLPRNCQSTDVFAFDTGPANMVIDALMNKYFDKPFDKNGAVARRGHVQTSLLDAMMSHPYFGMKPPKSTGREVFGEMFLQRIQEHTKPFKTEDIIATATYFTAVSVYNQYVRFVKKKCRIDELYVSGGGALNTTLMCMLSKLFAPVPVTTTEKLNISSDGKEAICFAILANETISEIPANLPRVTGAKRPTLLGSICL
jgi:anhydro-N-acetylmuramic acid kinase